MSSIQCKSNSMVLDDFWPCLRINQINQYSASGSNRLSLKETAPVRPWQVLNNPSSVTQQSHREKTVKILNTDVGDIIYAGKSIEVSTLESHDDWITQVFNAIIFIFVMLCLICSLWRSHIADKMKMRRMECMNNTCSGKRNYLALFIHTKQISFIYYIKIFIIRILYNLMINWEYSNIMQWYSILKCMT